MEDRRCKLGLSGRLELVRSIEQGSTLRPGCRPNIRGKFEAGVASALT
jgi:hypothetical protein